MHVSRFEALTRRLATGWAAPSADGGPKFVDSGAVRPDACCIYSCASAVTHFTTVTCHVGACPPIEGCVLTGAGVCQECGPARQ